MSRLGFRRAFAVLAMLFSVSVLMPGLATAAPSSPEQDGCSWSAKTPTKSGSYVWFGAPWNCQNAPGIYAEIHVRAWRDGKLVKEATFKNYGTFSGTFTTGIPCSSGTHTYRTSTFGYDGLPTAYYEKKSYSRSITC